MRLRSFQAATLSDAMQLVREALGDDAIIVATHDSGRGRGVQITAASEDPDEAQLEQIVTHPEENDIDPAGEIADILSFHSIPDRIARRLTRAAGQIGDGRSVEALAGALDEYYAFRPLPTGPRPLMLVGPPGAGKTVTVAKLAAQLAFEKVDATVITTDTLRSGAVAQLRGYMDVLGHDLLTAKRPQELAQAVAAHGDGRGLIIDTPGTNPFSDSEIADLRSFISAIDAEPVLVLPAGGDVEDAADIGRIFSRLGCRSALFTRVDGARRLGSMITAAEAGDLAFCHVSISPSVAQGLKALSPLSLARVLASDPLDQIRLTEVGVKTA
jgi:flagellar biosynthesis protein FlhF